MGRIHLFEFEDQSWLPAFLRNYMTDFLQFLSNKTAMFNPVVPLIEDTLIKIGTNSIIDLGSGGGGGLIVLNEKLKVKIPELKITLTDYYPNITAFEHTKSLADNFEYISSTLDARNVPVELTGLRTQFLSFHHFRPGDAAQILQNAVDTKNAIAIFEAQERSFSSILAMLFSPLTVLFITPFIRPFKTGRLIFTYLIPVIPLLILWDGIVSSIRTYSVKEMNELVKELKRKDNYHWKIGKLKSGPSKILYLIGVYKDDK